MVIVLIFTFRSSVLTTCRNTILRIQLHEKKKVPRTKAAKIQKMEDNRIPF